MVEKENRRPFRASFALMILLLALLIIVSLFTLLRHEEAPQTRMVRSNISARIAIAQPQPNSTRARKVAKPTQKPETRPVPRTKPEDLKAKAPAPNQPQTEPAAEIAASNPGAKTDLAVKPQPKLQIETENSLSETNALRLEKLFKQKGYQVEALVRVKQQTMYRLWVGRYANQIARRKLKEIKTIARGAFLIAAQHNYFDLYAGSFSSLNRARREADDLYAKKLRTRERQVSLPRKKVQLRFGWFKSQQEAEQARAELLKLPKMPKLQIRTDRSQPE